VTTRELTAFSTALALNVWHVLESAIVTASTIGLKVKTNLDATISSRSTYAGGDTAGTTTLLSRIIGTLAAGTHQPQSGDAYARLGAPVGASISADVASVQGDTNDLQTRLPAALVSGRIDSSVGAYPGNTPQTGDSFARLGAPAAASVSADIAALATEFAELVTLDDIQDAIVGPRVTVVADGGNTATAFKIDLTAMPADGPKDAWLSFDLTTTTAALRGQVKRVSAFNTTTDVITMAGAFTQAPVAGDTARLATR
jgi:hypothetical protein